MKKIINEVFQIEINLHSNLKNIIYSNIINKMKQLSGKRTKKDLKVLSKRSHKLEYILLKRIQGNTLKLLYLFFLLFKKFIYTDKSVKKNSQLL